MEELYTYVQQQLTTNEFAIAGVLSGLFYTILNYAKAIPRVLWQRFSRWASFTATIEEADPMYVYISRWVEATYPNKFRNVEYKIDETSSGNEHEEVSLHIDNNGNENEKLHMKHHVDYFFIWRNWRVLKIAKSRVKLENARSFKQVHMGQITISGLFAKQAIKKMVANHAYDLRKKEIVKAKKDRILTHTQGDYGRWNARYLTNFKKVSQMYLDVKDEILEDVENFQSKKKWYLDRGISYKRGYLFYGEAGVGKTQFVNALAFHTKRDVYYISISEVKQNDFSSLIGNIGSNSIIFLDDVDIQLPTRKKSKKGGVNLQTILSFMDGNKSPHDAIIILAANEIDKMDYALMRKGRLDKKFEFKKPSQKLLRDYVTKFYELEKTIEIEIPSVQINVLQNMCLECKDYEDFVLRKDSFDIKPFVPITEHVITADSQ